jgi:hypothetical protein
VRFLLEGVARAAKPAPQASAEEKTWSVHFESNGDIVIERITIRGRVDAQWLSAKASGRVGGE